MRFLARMLMALVCVLTVTPVVGAQARPHSAPRARQTSAVDHWVNSPHQITLSAGQQEKVDSLSVRYARELEHFRSNGDGDMGVVMRMQNLDRKYQALVRAVLTPDQRAVFNKNIRVPYMGL
jgi:Spy/CpxP family protein refolding chaperone